MQSFCRTFLPALLGVSSAALALAQSSAYVAIAGPSAAYPSTFASVVSVIGTASHAITQTAGVGTGADASALSADASTIYVASYINQSVTQISVQTQLPVGLQISLPFRPLSVARDPYFANSIYVGGANNLVVVDTNTAAITQSFPFGAVSLAPLPIGPGTSYIYASYQGSVYWIDAIHHVVQLVINLQQPPGVTAGKIVASTSTFSLFVQTINTASKGAVPSPIVTFISNGDAMQIIPVSQVARDIALSPDGKTLYATAGHDVFEWNTITQPPTPIGAFAAGKAPGQIVISGDSVTGYVADATNDIETLDLVGSQVTSHTGVLGAVRAMTLSQDGTGLFVANDSSVSAMVDLVTGQNPPSSFVYANFSGFDPFTSAISPNGQLLWSSCKSGNGVLVKESSLPTYTFFYQFAPSYAVFSADSATIFVTHSVGTVAKPQWALTSLNASNLLELGTTTLPAGLTVVGKPIVTPDGRSVFLPATGSKNWGIYTVSIPSSAVTSFIPLAGVTGITISPDAQTLYAAYNTPFPSIAFINITSKTITRSLSPAVATNLQYITVSTDGTRVYAAGTGVNTSQVFGINVADNGNPVYATLPDSGLSGIAITPDGTKLFVSDRLSQNVLSLNTMTGAVINQNFVFGYSNDVVIAPH